MAIRKFGADRASAYANFDQSYEHVNTYSQGTAGGAYTVRAGDSLQSIAQSVYGDSQLWYKIAEANGLSGNAGLAEGTVISLPTGITRNSNRADTTRPFNPADAIGDVSPTTPQPGQGPKCGVFGKIFLAVVAVAVTSVLTGGLAGGFASAFSGGSFSSGFAAGFGATTALNGAVVGAATGGGRDSLAQVPPSGEPSPGQQQRALPALLLARALALPQEYKTSSTSKGSHSRVSELAWD